MFTRILSAATLAGFISGLLLTAIQQIEIAPIILEAEVQEKAAITASPAVHASASPSAHPHEAWTPEDGWPRVLATIAANTVLAVAFALLLGSAMAQRGNTGWRAGLLWGLAGYAVFFVAPSLGLPPELPGAEAAPLRDRTLWWIATAILSASGLWLAVFAKNWPLRVAGLVLIGAPHIVGAPHPSRDMSPLSPALAKEFLRATYLANGAFWLLLGALLGSLNKSHR